ncbi:hypothetical protein DRO97_07300 [Archaeoglobales archaeon]|nr:MAG: hypothetical protein DRO97_07300 [Archaeoglobales archaeon]
MISKIRIENFKSIEKLELKLAPLTIFVGSNGSGKSSVIETLAFLRQGMERKISSAYNAELVKLGTFKEVIHRGDKSKWLRIEFHTKVNKNEAERLEKSWDLPDGVAKLNKKRVEMIGYGIGIRENDTRHKALINDRTIVEVCSKEDKIFSSVKNYLPEGTLSHILYSNNFILYKEGIGRKGENFSKEFTKLMRDELSRVYYISTIRWLLPRTVQISGQDVMGKDIGSKFSELRSKGEEWVGVNGEYAIHMLSMIFGNRELRYKREKIIKWASEFGIKDIESGWTGRGLELKPSFEDPELKVVLNPASAGYGSRQILPVITQLFYSEAGSTIMIEEPEISMHMEYQLKLPKMFSEAVKEGKQIIITTHSEHLIMALKPLIASGELSHQDVAIYHFEKTRQGTKVERLRISETGIIEGWIPSYIKVEKEFLREWFKTLPTA